MQIMFFMDLISEIGFLSQVSGGCNRWAGDHSMSKIPIFPLLARASTLIWNGNELLRVSKYQLYCRFYQLTHKTPLMLN